MKYLKFVISFVIVLIITIGFFVGKSYFKVKGFEEKRGEILSEINAVLETATQSGEYRCCIVPACKMCFLGNWIFEDGRCDCDTFIAQKKWDEVCPECKRGIEEGKCTSEIGTCSIED